MFRSSKPAAVASLAFVPQRNLRQTYCMLDHPIRFAACTGLKLSFNLVIWSDVVLPDYRARSFIKTLLDSHKHETSMECSRASMWCKLGKAHARLYQTLLDR